MILIKWCCINWRAIYFLQVGSFLYFCVKPHQNRIDSGCLHIYFTHFPTINRSFIDPEKQICYRSKIYTRFVLPTYFPSHSLQGIILYITFMYLIMYLYRFLFLLLLEIVALSPSPILLIVECGKSSFRSGKVEENHQLKMHQYSSAHKTYVFLNIRFSLILK